MANLFDIQPLISALDELLKNKGVTKPEIVNWFKTQFVNWFVSSTDDREKNVQAHQYKAGEPEWAKKSDIVDFNGFTNEQTDSLNHTIDYFNSLDDIDLKKIYKEPVETIKKKVAEWDTFLKKQQAKEPVLKQTDKDIQVVKSWSGGFNIVKLLSKAAYETEGNLMGHCVGSAGYFDRKDITIYSLRDSRNEPHVTMEVRGYFQPENIELVKGIKQIKGKENKAPIEKYRPYVIQFIDDNKLVIKEDGENIGYVEWDWRFYNPKSQEWQEIYQNEIVPVQKQKVQEILSKIKDSVYEGDIDLRRLYLTQLPIDLKDVTVTGNFDCYDNQLTSLQGAPKEDKERAMK